MNEELIRMIEENLAILDYEKRLNIKKYSLPIVFWVKTASATSLRPSNPTFYVVNTLMKYPGLLPLEVFATLIVARAVRCRRQSGDGKLETFWSLTANMSQNFYEITKSFVLYPQCGEYEVDTEIIGRIAGAMKQEDYPMREIAQMILMNASEINEKYGQGFVEDSICVTA